MMFALLIQGSPTASQAADTSLRFARAALAAGHGIRRVFFFHDGVHSANAFAAPPPGENSIRADWTELAKRHGIELAVCVTAASRRGVADAEQSMREHLPGPNMHPDFTPVGLGQLVEAMLHCDRLITFSG
jgi:tRNA 2-thiouridine synthesizing protein D